MKKNSTRSFLILSQLLFLFGWTQMQGQNSPGATQGCFNNNISFSLTPEPTDGAYEPGDVVEVCATFAFTNPSVIFVHGVQPYLPPGWDPATLNPASMSSTCGGGSGTWTWQGPGTFYGDTYGVGYYYLGHPSNWGESCVNGTFTMCFEVSVDADCGGPGSPLNGEFIFPGFNVTGDNSSTGSGGWIGGVGGLPCDGVYVDASFDPDFPVITIDCCDAESGTSPGTLDICNNGAFDLYDELGDPKWDSGTWTDPNGDPVGAGNSYMFDPQSSLPGDYTYTVLGTDDCVSSTTITLEFINLGQYASISKCTSVGATFTIQSELPPPPFGPFPDHPDYSGTWTAPDGVDLPDGVGTLVPGTNPSGVYTYSWLDDNNCPSTLTVPVNIVLDGTDAAPAATMDVCLTEPPFLPYDSLGGSPFPSSNASWFYEPNSGGFNILPPGGSGAVVDPSNWSNSTPPQPLQSGFFVYFAISGPCFITDTIYFDVHEPPNTGEFAEVNICISDPPVSLISLLGGTPEDGLEWVDATLDVIVPDELNPADYNENDVLIFSYSGGLAGTSCFQQSNLVVTILPADADAGEFNSVDICETDGAVCLTDLLEGTPQAGGQWTSPSGVTSGCIFNPATGESGIWTYTITTSCDSDTQTLEVNVVSQADAGTDGVLAICDNETNVPLFGGLGGSPDPGPQSEWFLGVTPVGDLVDGNAVNDGDVYTYSVGTGNCQAFASVTIDLQTAPFAGTAPAAPVVFCETDPAIALIDEWDTPPTTPPSAPNATWTGPGGFTGPILNPATAQSGTYTYTITTADCGSDSESIEVVIEPIPNAGTDATITACPNDTDPVNLLGILGADPGGTWTAPPGGPDGGTFSPGDPAGDYVYNLNPSGVCGASATVTVNVPALPDPGTDGALTVCEGDPAFNLIDFLGGTPDPGVWNFAGAPFGPANATFTPGTDTPGTYTYEAGDGTCPAVTAVVEVTVVDDPDAGDNTTLTVCETLGTVDLTGFLGGTPDAGGTWSVPNPYDISAICGTTENLTYTVDNGTCQDVATLALTVECVPNAGGNGILEFCSSEPCFDLSDGLDPPFDAGGTWTDANGDEVTDNQCPNALGTGGTFTYTVEGTDCNDASASVTVEITPSMVFVDLQADCEASQLTYVVVFEILGGQGPFEISGTEIAGTETTGAVYTSNPIPAGTDYAFTVTDNSNCADLIVNGTAPNCACPATASFVNGNQTICEGEDAVFEFDVTGAPPFDITVNDGTADIVFTGYTAGATVTVSPTDNTLYTLVSVEDANCQNAAAGSVNVNVDVPLFAGPDVSLDFCAQAGNLTLSTVIDVAANTGGEFTTVPGGDVVTTLPYTPASSGTYLYTVGPNACPSDEAVYDLTVYDPISTSDVTAACNAAQTEYTVTFDIDGGTGTGTYTVTGMNGGTVTGNTFTSNPLDPTADPNYAFQVSDNGPCADADVSGNAPNCACPATAALTGGGITICSGETASLPVNLQGDGPWTITYDAGGVAVGPVVLNAGETIDVAPAVTTVYTLTSVEDQNCAGSVSGSITVTVDDPPNAGPDVDIELCGGAGNLTLNTILDPGAQDGGSFTDAGGTTVTSVPNTPASSGVYTYTIDNNSCPSDEATYDITIYNPISVTDVSTACNAAQTEYTVTFDLDGGTGTYTVTGMNGGTVTGNTFTSNPIDPTGDPIYGFQVSDNGPCAEVDVTGNAPNCDCPATAALTGGGQTICSGETASLPVNLQGDGPWTVIYDAGGVAGGPVVLNAGETIDVTPAVTTVYTLTSVEDQNCTGSVSGTITVTVDNPPNAGSDVDVPALCGGPGNLILEDLLDAGADTPGTFTVNGNTVTTVPLTSASSGVYTYTTEANACPADEATYDITIFDPIEVNAVTVECNLAQTEYTVSFNISGGTGNYTVTGTADGTLTGNTFTSDLIDGDDDYSFTIFDDGPCDEVVISDLEPDCDCQAVGSLSGSTNICAGSSTDIIVSLTGVPPFSITYQNSNDPGNPTTLNNIFDGHAISVSPGTSATYTLTSVSDANCTGAVEGTPVDITVDPPLNVGDANITCDDTGDTYTVQIVVTGGVAPINVTNSTGGTGPVFTSLPVNSGSSYSMVVSDAGACPNVTSSGSFTCPCTTEAGALLDDAFEICTNESATVTADGNAVLDGNDTFQYVLHDGSPSELGTVLLISNDGTFTYDGSLETGTVYYISAVAGNENVQGNVDLNDPCLSVSNGLEIMFYDLPTATFAGDLTVCEGSEAELVINFTGQGPWSFAYELNGQPVAGTVESAGSSTILAVTEPGTYTITDLTDANCSDNSGSEATVNTFDTPTAVIGGDPEVCENSGDGPEVTFTGSAPWTFEYSINGEVQGAVTTSTNPHTIPAFESGTFALESLSDANCEGTTSGSVDVTFIDVPVADLTGGGTVCAGDSAVFNVSLTGQAPWTIAYTVDGVPQTPLTSDVPNFTFESGVSGTYAVTSVTDQVCQGLLHNNNASLIVNATPSGEISASTNLACIGQEVKITFTLQGNGPFNVIYAVNGTETALNGISQNHILTLTPTEPMIIELLSIEDSSTPVCSSEEVANSIFVQVTELPNAPVLTDDTICSGGGPVPIGVSSAPGLSYSWTPTTGLSDSKVSNPTLDRTVQGTSPRVFTYILTASNADCSVSDTVNITVEPRPQARFRFSPDPVTSEDPRIYFLNTSIATETTIYFWDFGGLGSSTSKNPDFRFPEGRDGDYTVTLTAVDPVTGCTSTFTATVRVRKELLVYVPNAFTPDGDGKNDLWGPVLTNVEKSDYRLTIFDRLGNVVFETTDINQKWNGGQMNSGYYLEAGMYIWVIEGREIGAIEDFEMRGHVILLR